MRAGLHVHGAICLKGVIATVISRGGLFVTAKEKCQKCERNIKQRTSQSMVLHAEIGEHL